MAMPVLFVLIGLVVIGFGVREAAHQRHLRREGVRAEGMVVRHRRTHDSEGGTSYFAVVNFVDAQGIPHEFESKVSGTRGLPVGGQCPVTYLPGAPKSARIDLASKRLVAIVFPLVGGAAFVCVAVALFPGR